MRLAAYVVVVFVCAGSANAWGRSIAKPNQEFRRWQKERRLQGSVTNTINSTSQNRKAKVRLQSPTPADGEIRIPDDDRPLGYMPTVIDKSYLSDLNIANIRSVQVSMGLSASLPATFDLRDHGRVTAIKNQSAYGTCWSHATMASIESFLLSREGVAYDLSEKQLAQNHDWDMGYEGFSAGGNGDIAASFLTQWRGPILENQDPYPADSYYDRWYADYTNGVIYVLNSILPKSPNVPAIGHVQHIRWIPAMHYSTNTNPEIVKNELIPIKQALMEHGALYVNYFHCQSFYKDFDGNYQTVLIDGNLYYYGSSWMDTFYFPYDRRQYRGGGHAVAIVGWDDNFSKNNFRITPPGDGAFIVKNSWGTTFGMDGYFYVSYYDRYFAKEELMSFSSVEPQDNYSSIYQYDPMGNVRPWSPVSGGGETAWGSNMFTATNSEPLAAVGFYAFAPNTRYQISIRVGCEVGKPISGSVRLTQNGMTEFAGYVTIPLSQTVTVEKGQRFSVTLQLTTPGVDEPLALEGMYYYETRAAMANVGESFASEDGKNWADLTSIRMDYGSGTYNFCCKAYTKSATAAKPTLSSIAISGMLSLASGKDAQFMCEATYSDGSKKNVSPTWSITEGRNYATISSSGLVTAKNVTTQELVKVKALYKEGSVTKDAIWGLYVTAGAPAKPEGVTATEGTESSCIRVTWTAPNGATEYAVYRATANNSKNAQYLEKVTVPKFNDTTAAPGIDYWYFVKAKNASDSSDFSAGAKGWRKLSPPDGVTATDDLADKVTVKWDAVDGAKAYRVYKATSIDGTPSPISGWITATSFDDTTVTAGVTYYYYVKAAVDANGNRPSDYSIIEDGKRAVPVTLDSLSISGAASIPSGGNATYTAAAIYTDGSTKTVAPSSWSVSPTTCASVSGGKVTAKTVSQNQTVTLTARYSEGGRTATGTKEIVITAVPASVPTGLAVASQSTGVVLTWNVATGASSYKVYRAESGGAASVVGTVDVTTFTDKTATPGVTYSYSVTAVNGAGESARSSTVTAMLPLSAPTGVTATSDRTDGVVISWQRVAGDTRTTYYRVSRATSETGTKTDVGSWTTGNTYMDNPPNAGTRYYYFVRAATSSSGANASGYSAAVRGMKVIMVTLSSIAVEGADKVQTGNTALYVCKATYSDGTTKQVSPNWSVLPTSAATIDANGRLATKAVSANKDVTLSASFTDGVTKTATKAVTVLAVAKAKAEVKDVTTTSRWPFAAILDVDYTLVMTPSTAKATMSLYGRDEERGVDMEAKTVTGDGADGSYISAGRHRLTWDVGTDYPGLSSKSLSVTVTAIPSFAAIPENVTASSNSTSEVKITWKAVDGATGYEIWRGTGTTTNGTERIATIANGSTTAYSDTTAVAGTAYRYWIRALSEYGTGEFGQPVAGMRALPAPVSIAISGPASVTAGETASYACTVVRNDGTTGTIAPTWTITSGSSYASISSSGVLSANGTATQRSVTIQASYTQNGTTKTATTSVTITTKSVTITFKPNGGNTPAPQNYTAYGMYGSLPASTRTGYTFAGWYTASSGGTRVTTSSTVPASDTTLWAHWTASTYTVTLDMQGGNGGTASVTATYGSAMPAIAVPTRSGYSFGGYYTEANGGGSQYYTESGVGTRTWNKPYATVLYAHWTAQPCTIHFNANGGEGTMPDLTMACGESFTVPSSSFHCASYRSNYSGGVEVHEPVFYGWATNQYGRGSLFYPGTVASGLTAVAGGSVTLYAMWDNIRWEISSDGTLTDVYIPDCVTAITIPTELKELKSFTPSSTNLISVTVDGANVNYASSDGMIFSKNLSVLYFCPRGRTNVVVPNSVTNIQERAFEGCCRLKDIVVPPSVRAIEWGAFSGCSGLERMTLPFVGSDVKSGDYNYNNSHFGWIFGEKSFEGAALADQYYVKNSGGTTFSRWYVPEKLKDITITGEKIAAYAFSGVKTITNVTMTASTVHLGYLTYSAYGVPTYTSRIFYECSNLRSVRIAGKLSFYDLKELFLSTPEDLTTYVTSAWTGPTGTWCDRPVIVK